MHSAWVFLKDNKDAFSSLGTIFAVILFAFFEDKKRFFERWR
jgi:hypothetical protein